MVDAWAIVGGGLATTRLTELNIGIEEFVDHSFYEPWHGHPHRVDPLGNPVSPHHPWSKTIHQSADTEAARSRAAFLHGGRAPPTDQDARETENIRREIERVARPLPMIRFHEIPEHDTAGPMTVQWDRAVWCLRQVVSGPIYRVVYMPEAAPLQAARIIVPRLENFSEAMMRVGPRMPVELELAAEPEMAGGVG